MPKPNLQPFECGCGVKYSCSSSLNFHLKKVHDGKIPEKTILGPRGLKYFKKEKIKDKRLLRKRN